MYALKEMDLKHVTKKKAKRLKHTGVGVDIWDEIMNERDKVLPSSLCPWPTRGSSYHRNDTESYYGGHHDTTITHEDSKRRNSKNESGVTLILLSFFSVSFFHGSNLYL